MAAAGDQPAGKCPPLGISVQWRRSHVRAAQERGDFTTSFGEMAHPVGTSIRVGMGWNCPTSRPATRVRDRRARCRPSRRAGPPRPPSGTCRGALREFEPEVVARRCSPVAAQRAEAGIPEPGHELDHRGSDALHVPSGALGRAGETEAGRETQTTWKAGPSSPVLAGSRSGSMMGSISATDPGHPWSTSRGTAPGRSARAWMKWMRWPSMSVMNCGHRVACRRLRKSVSTAAGTSTTNGPMIDW